MKRKTTSTPVRIWSYGCTAPRGNIELLQEQLAKAHAYYNELVAIERARREQFRQVRTESSPEVAAREAELARVTAAIDAERAELQAKRQQARKRVRDPEAERRIRELLAERKAIGLGVREERARYAASLREFDQALGAEVQAGLLAIGMTGPRAVEKVRLEKSLGLLEAKEPPDVWKWSVAVTGAAVAAKKAARAACGLSSGTYLLVEKAVESSKEPEFRSIGRLRRRDWTPETQSVFARYLRGRIGVTMRGVVTVADLFNGTGTQLRIAPLPAAQWDTRRGRGKAFTDVLVRLASGEKGEPIWTSLRATLHRKPPMDARVRGAWLLVDHDRLRTTFTLQLALESDSFTPVGAPGGGTVAVDFGWRPRERGIRVAYVVDDRGREREFILPEAVPDMLRQAAAIQGAQDVHFNQARGVLVSWLGEEAAPEWLTAMTEHVALWRGHSRLLTVADRLRAEHLTGGETDFWTLWKLWKAERFAAPGGKLDLFAPASEIGQWGEARGVRSPLARLALYLGLWRQKEWHLYHYASGMRVRAVRRRHDLYRCFVKELRQTYETVLYEDMEIATARYARTAKPEAEAATVTELHRLQREAAPGELKQLLAEACGRSGVAMEAAYSSRRCHLCRHVNEPWQDTSVIVQTCAGCGAAWDMDANACKNFLIAHSEGSGGDETPGGARTPGNPARPAAPDMTSLPALQRSTRNRSQSGS